MRCRKEVAFRKMEVRQVLADSTDSDRVHEALESSGSNLDPLVEAFGSFPKSSVRQGPAGLKKIINCY